MTIIPLQLQKHIAGNSYSAFGDLGGKGQAPSLPLQRVVDTAHQQCYKFLLTVPSVLLTMKTTPVYRKNVVTTTTKNETKIKWKGHVMSEGWAPAASFGKAFHKGEPLLASLLSHQTSLKSHYPPRDMEEILFLGE